ncbi:MAG: alpha-amylase/4-alpha-glucanotransferase domain-containing protein [Gemmatimonadota bacterium]
MQPAGPSRVLLLCLHNHQPVGNFEFVLEEACRKAYLPFLETLNRFPGIKVTVHFSGFLLQWIARKQPAVFGLLKDLAARGQIEVLGGGMYEPVLALLPERDRLGQLKDLADTVGRYFGRRPRGIWLAERVWEPDVTGTLAAAGVDYLPLDDYHFLRAGLSPEELDGQYLTEVNGAAVRLFPGSELLRYLIPFGGVDQALDAIDRLTARDAPYPAAIFADDGEKFGIWPGTHKSVYEDGWLHRFFEGIDARKDRLATMTLGEYAAAAPLRGRVYLPTCSYIEMGEWTLPPGPAARFGGLLHEMRAGKHGWFKPFAQGGHFRSFLRKYEESNQLHKRMLLVSERVEEARKKGGSPEARDFLYRSQCNDVYWHGVFGGLYLNHLREAAHSNLLRAEEAADRVIHGGKTGWTEVVTGDIDADGGTEHLVKTPSLSLLAHAHDGGALTEISLPKRGIALAHVLTRRAEGYHEKLRAKAGGAFDGSASIHDVLLLKDPSVLSALAVDPWQRASFRESVYGADSSAEAILADSVPPLFATAGRQARSEVTRRGTRVVLAQELPLAWSGAALSLEKVLHVDAGEEAFQVKYRVANRGRETVSAKFATEWNLNFLSGSGPDRRYEGIGGKVEDLASRGATSGLREFRIVDAWRRIAVGVTSDREFTLLRYPIETASLSEAGAEKIHQGVCLRLLFTILLKPGDYEYYSLLWAVKSVAS